MKKIVTLVFAAVLSLAVLNVMASDKKSKKAKMNKKVKVVNLVNKQVNNKLNSKTPEGKVVKSKVITIENLRKLKQKAAQK